MNRINSILCFAFLAALSFGSVFFNTNGASAKTPFVDLKVERLRLKALNQAKPTIDPNHFKAIDPDFAENQKAIADQTLYFAKRKITTIKGQPSYLVTQRCSLYNTKYSLQTGQLETVTFSEKPAYCTYGIEFPNYAYSYNYPEGKLQKIMVYTSKEEAYIFKLDGTLYAHWNHGGCDQGEASICKGSNSKANQTSANASQNADASANIPKDSATPKGSESKKMDNYLF